MATSSPLPSLSAVGESPISVSQALHFHNATVNIINAPANIAQTGGSNTNTLASDSNMNRSLPDERPPPPTVIAKAGGTNERVRLHDGVGHVEADGAGSRNEEVDISRTKATSAEPAKSRTWVVVTLAVAVIAFLPWFFDRFFPRAEKSSMPVQATIPDAPQE